MSQFHGDLDELKAIIEVTGIQGTWTEHENNQHRFSSKAGGILCWWDNKKKTLLFQGQPASKDALEAAFNAAVQDSGTVAPVKNPSLQSSSTRVFVVHGHDEQAREQLERILMILGLEPFVLQNTSGGGLTIIEALERQIGREPEAKFGIILMTPDDIGYSIKAGVEQAEPRPRQNVVMEMGMLLASLTRARCVVLVKGHMELPSDAQGIIYLHFNSHVKETVPKLSERLKSAGFDISAEQLSKAAI